MTRKCAQNKYKILALSVSIHFRTQPQKYKQNTSDGPIPNSRYVNTSGIDNI